MKQVMRLFFAVSVLSIAACQQPSDKRVTNDTAITAKQFQKPDNKFAGIQFASKKDTSCGMPLSAGLEDTVQLNGKVYGFCSKECKADFVAKLQKEHKR